MITLSISLYLLGCYLFYFLSFERMGKEELIGIIVTTILWPFLSLGFILADSVYFLYRNMPFKKSNRTNQ